MAKKTISCPCGWSITTESDDELVTKVQEHAKQVHNQESTREQILAMARPA